MTILQRLTTDQSFVCKPPPPTWPFATRAVAAAIWFCPRVVGRHPCLIDKRAWRLVRYHSTVSGRCEGTGGKRERERAQDRDIKIPFTWTKGDGSLLHSHPIRQEQNAQLFTALVFLKQ